MQRIHKITAVLAILAFTALSAAGIPSRPYPPRLVNDFAGVLPNHYQTLALEKMLSDFNDSTSNQIAVVTVNDLEGMSPSEYATELGHSWGVGSEKFDNGIVILVKPKTSDSQGQVNISIGYGLEGAIPDSYASRIISAYMIPAFQSGDYYAGIERACTVLMKLASGEISEPVEEEGLPAGMIAGLILFVFVIVLAAAAGRGGRNGGNHGGGRFEDNDGDFMRGLIIGNILGSGGSRTGGYSGGFGGGSFGGGFGGFGGGSFGGGGASGSW